MIIVVNFQFKQLERRSLKKNQVTGSNPVEAPIFFRLLLSNCLNWKFTTMIILHFLKIYSWPIVSKSRQGIQGFPWRVYLITLIFRDTFISQFCGAHISRLLNSAILRQFCNFNHFNFSFLSNTQPIPLAMLLCHVLEFTKPTLSKLQRR